MENESLSLDMDDEALVNEFAGLFGDTPDDFTPDIEGEPKAHATIEEDAQEGTEEAEEAVEEYELDMTSAIPVKIGDQDFDVTLDELSKSYVREAEYNVKIGLLADRATTLRDMETKAIEALELAKLECDLILEDSKDIDMSSLSAEDFKEMSLKKQRLAAKSSGIKARLDELKPRHQEMANQERLNEARTTFTQLSREVPGFSVEMYNSALNHAVTVLGCNKDFITNCTDAGILKAIMSANDSYVSPERLKKSTMPRKVARVAAPVAKAKDYSRESDLMSLAESLF